MLQYPSCPETHTKARAYSQDLPSYLLPELPLPGSSKCAVSALSMGTQEVYSLQQHKTIDRSYQCLPQSGCSIDICQINPQSWNKFTILSYKRLHLIVEMLASGVGLNQGQEEEDCL